MSPGDVVYLLKNVALLFLLLCVTSCSGEASKEQKHISAGAELISKSADTITGRYYSVERKDGQPSSLRVLDVKSFTVEQVVYDLVEYSFNPKPSNVEMILLLGTTGPFDPDPEGTLQRRRDRLPKPYALTGIKGAEKKGVEAPLSMDKPNEKSLSCYSYTAKGESELVFEFCEGGYRGVNFGRFRHLEDYDPKAVVAQILAANPGFPETVPDFNASKSPIEPANFAYQDVTTDVQFDGEIIASAAFCLGNMGLLPNEEARKIGLEYIKCLKRKYGEGYAEPLFYIFKGALIAGEKAQQKRGMQDCDKRIAAFDELAKIIGYQRPSTSTKE